MHIFSKWTESLRVSCKVLLLLTVLFKTIFTASLNYGKVIVIQAKLIKNFFRLVLVRKLVLKHQLFCGWSFLRKLSKYSSCRKKSKLCEFFGRVRGEPSTVISFRLCFQILWNEIKLVQVLLIPHLISSDVIICESSANKCYYKVIAFVTENRLYIDSVITDPTQ